MRSLAIAVAAASLALSACATTGRISTDFDAAQSFSEYRTFAWAGERPMVVLGARVVPATVQVQIENAIRADLISKGYSYTDNLQEADFAVSFTVGTRDGTETMEVPDYFWNERARWGWGNVYWPRLPTMPRTTTQVREYTEGTLSVDIYDVARRSPVWHGKGQRNLTRAELRGDTNTAGEDVKLILAKFPPD